jgi:hypothetical protein
VDKIVISGIRGYDGEYPFDASYFTNKEFHTIKRLAGIRAGEIKAAFDSGDNDLIVAFAVIALERSGKAVFEEVLWNANVGCIALEGDAATEDDAVPPTPSSEDDRSGKSDSSGLSSRNGSGHPENDPSPTGQPISEPSAA